jgi:hypothetical protein
MTIKKMKHQKNTEQKTHPSNSKPFLPQKILSVFLLMFLLFVSSAFAFTGAGAGTIGDPYVITTPSQLNETKDDLTAYYDLGNDIDMASFGDWTPSGNWDIEPFSGSFDGNGFTISNLYIPVYDEGVGGRPFGLFGYLDVVDYIRNVNLENCQMESVPLNLNGDAIGITGIGCLIGGADETVGEISNIHITGSINTPNVTFVGGLAGWIGTVTNPVHNLSFEGSINALNYGSGLISDGIGYSITDSYTTGNITINSDGSSAYVGGLYGNMDVGQSIIDSYSLMDIYINYAGAYLGTNRGVGGLIGFKNVNIIDSYYGGTISLSGSSVQNGTIQGGTATINATCNDVYFDSTKNAGLVSGCDSATGLTTANAKIEGSYVGFDFTSTWSINEALNDGYPYLTSQNLVVPANPVQPNITITPNQTITIGDPVLVEGLGCPIGLDCFLYLNDSLVSNPYNLSLGVGIYQFVYNTSGNVDYTPENVESTLIVESQFSLLDFYDGSATGTCPFVENNPKQVFYIVILLVSITMIMFAVIIDNALIGLFGSILLLYIGLISQYCDGLVTLMLVLAGLIMIVYSLTQLTFVKGTKQ